MTEKSSQPLNTAVLSEAFERRCQDLATFLEGLQGRKMPERDLLIQQLGMNNNRQPGFFDESSVRIVHRVVPSTIPSKYTSKATFAKLVVRNTLDNLISDLENQVINGKADGDSIQGLLSYSSEAPLERNGHSLQRFCEDVIKEYLHNGHNGQDGSPGESPFQPKHVIMLPRQDKQRITEQQELGGLRVLSSDFLPEGCGLIFSTADLHLFIDPELKWKNSDNPERYPFFVHYRAGMAKTKKSDPLVWQINYC